MDRDPALALTIFGSSRETLFASRQDGRTAVDIPILGAGEAAVVDLVFAALAG